MRCKLAISHTRSMYTNHCSSTYSMSKRYIFGFYMIHLAFEHPWSCSTLEHSLHDLDNSPEITNILSLSKLQGRRYQIIFDDSSGFVSFTSEN